MKLIDIGHKHPPFDVASGLAAALLATGTVEPYVAPIFNVQPGSSIGKHITHFQCREGDIIEDYQFPPFIAYSCDTCGKGRISGPNSHKAKVFHQAPKGFAQDVPGDVAVEFIRLRKEYDKRSKKS